MSILKNRCLFLTVFGGGEAQDRGFQMVFLLCPHLTEWNTEKASSAVSSPRHQASELITPHRPTSHYKNIRDRILPSDLKGEGPSQTVTQIK